MGGRKRRGEMAGLVVVVLVVPAEGAGETMNRGADVDAGWRWPTVAAVLTARGRLRSGGRERRPNLEWLWSLCSTRLPSQGSSRRGCCFSRRLAAPPFAGPSFSSCTSQVYPPMWSAATPTLCRRCRIDGGYCSLGNKESQDMSLKFHSYIEPQRHGGRETRRPRSGMSETRRRGGERKGIPIFSGVRERPEL